MHGSMARCMAPAKTCNARRRSYPSTAAPLSIVTACDDDDDVLVYERGSGHCLYGGDVIKTPEPRNNNPWERMTARPQ